MKKKPIDFSGGSYTALEEALASYLDIKVMLVQGWKVPESYRRAEAMRFISHFNRGDDITEKEAAYDHEEQLMLTSLREKITSRDPLMGISVTDNELWSLQKVGHVTLRVGNCEPEQAVLIFDPVDMDLRQEWDVELRWALSASTFHNAWGERRRDSHDIPASDFVENFDITSDDRRAFQSLMNIRYALMNQTEYNDQGRGMYDEPYFYRFTRIARDDNSGMYKSYFEMPYDECVKRLEIEQSIRFNKIGIKDPAFHEKFTRARAVGGLIYNILPGIASETAARLDLKIINIAATQRHLHEKLQEALDNKPNSGRFRSDGLSDWRILFPLFREVHERDESTGPARQYLDKIMEGLQAFFPTITNGPVPDLDMSKEPPRTIEGYKSSAGATPPAPPPSPPGPG